MSIIQKEQNSKKCDRFCYIFFVGAVFKEYGEKYSSDTLIPGGKIVWQQLHSL